MAKHILSKSTFIKGIQCRKQLFLQKKKPFLRDKIPPERLARFKRGHTVGEWIYYLFPKGVNLAPKSHFQYQKAVEDTKQAIRSGVNTIYEAAFQYDDVLVLLDVLDKKEGKWYAYEVKSSKSISEVFRKDAALQNYVIEGSGLVLEDFFLVHVNEDYLFEGKMNYEKYFCFASVKKEAEKQKEYIEKEVKTLKGVLSKENVPEIMVGKHCFMPYECDFIGYCWQTFPEQHVFLFHQSSLAEKQLLLDEGIKELSKILEPKTELQRMQIKAVKANAPVMKKRLIKSFYENLGEEYEVFSLLSFAHAQTLIVGTKPFQNIPIAYGSERGNLIHLFDKEEEIKPFVKSLFEYIEGAKKLLVYDKERFQKTIQSWDKEGKMEVVIREKVFGLSEIFLSGAYYYPLFLGDISLKNVAGLMFGDRALYSDELLNYELFENYTDALRIKNILSMQLASLQKINNYFRSLQ